MCFLLFENQHSQRQLCSYFEAGLMQTQQASNSLSPPQELHKIPQCFGTATLKAAQTSLEVLTGTTKF